MKSIVLNRDGTTKEIEIPDIPVDNTEETLMQIQECLQYLKDTDYITNKLAEAESEFIETGDNTEVLALREHYSEELATRKNKREKIRELENLLKVE